MQKLLITSLFIIISSSSISQNIDLSGEFCKTELPNGVGECFNFNKDKSFTFISGFDLPPSQKGVGKFKVQKNILVLEYEKIEPYFDSYHTKSKTYSNDGTINFTFTIKDLNGKPIPSAQISFEDYSNSKTDGILLDKNGIGFLEFRKSEGFVKFRISNIGYNDEIIELDKDYNYNLHIYLSSKDQEIPIEPHIDSLIIVKSKNDLLKLKDLSNGKISEWNKQ